MPGIQLGLAGILCTDTAPDDNQGHGTPAVRNEIGDGLELLGDAVGRTLHGSVRGDQPLHNDEAQLEEGALNGDGNADAEAAEHQLWLQEGLAHPAEGHGHLRPLQQNQDGSVGNGNGDQIGEAEAEHAEIQGIEEERLQGEGDHQLTNGAEHGLGGAALGAECGRGGVEDGIEEIGGNGVGEEEQGIVVGFCIQFSEHDVKHTDPPGHQ